MRNNPYWSGTATWLRTRNQFTKVLIVACADLAGLTAAVILAYALRISALELPRTEALPLYFIAPIMSVISAAVFGVYASASRSYTTHVERRILNSQLLIPPVWAIVLLTFGAVGFARSVLIIYLFLAIALMLAMRRFMAWLFQDPVKSVPKRQRIPVAIYGAGNEGSMLVDSLNQQGRYRPVVFLDTDYTLVGRTVAGLRVMDIDEMSKLVTRFNLEEVMIAKSGQSRSNRRVLVDKFLDHGLRVKTIPAQSEIVDGKIDVNALRPINLEDLLGRDPVPPERDLMEKAIKGKVVLVTGAGGSIGAEIVRQIAPFSPAKIVMLDNNEFSLFEINRDMEAKQEKLPQPLALVPVLADVLDSQRIESIMRSHEVEVVFHAAAYKHVRMVQENPLAGIRNNVWGTKVLAEAALKHGVKLFVLISTDKAVRPTSVMGASKRVAEMVVQGLAKRAKSKTVFTIVRFGNVLGSTGSVIPLFKEQIAKGGPVLVTHPDVTRFFMLIPEAAQLVIQAGGMASSGDVYVLDMGESVKIINLAETMIELAGMTRKSADNPGGDIEIKIVGLHPGEKLYEELQIGNDVSSTTHPRIMGSSEFYLEWKELESELSVLGKMLEREGQTDASKTLMALAGLGSHQAHS